ncbi:hypothetical protein IAT38_000114 [Cryptococcus sp. DSM 104549]
MTFESFMLFANEKIYHDEFVKCLPEISRPHGDLRLVMDTSVSVALEAHKDRWKCKGGRMRSLPGILETAMAQAPVMWPLSYLSMMFRLEQKDMYPDYKRRMGFQNGSEAKRTYHALLIKAVTALLDAPHKLLILIHSPSSTLLPHLPHIQASTNRLSICLGNEEGMLERDVQRLGHAVRLCTSTSAPPNLPSPIAKPIAKADGVSHGSAAVRKGSARALAESAEQWPSQVGPTNKGLQEQYVEKAKPLVPEYDQFGMIIPETVNRPDPWEARVAIATALEKTAPLLSEDMIAPIFDFLIKQEVLGDRHSAVRSAMLNAAIKIIDLHGGKTVASLMKRFEDYLGSAVPSSETTDYIKEAVVILFGRLAGHLDFTDPRIPTVVDRLVDALNTPSELVQSAVADCLPPLVLGMEEEVEYLADRLFSTLTTGAKYAARRGAAYGLAGVVKGRGLVSLKGYGLMDKLKEAAEDKTSYQSRQGALFAYETLSTTLGKIFEPYVIEIIPQLLALFGDSSADVREANQDSSRVIMSRVSGHCVKLMLPTLLDALEDKQWRTKKGAIELLGAMAFCAPRQLSLSLPTIIPHLTGVINDSHSQVKAAAKTSLKRFSEVLNNPDLKSIQSILIKELADPTARTNSALTELEPNANSTSSPPADSAHPLPAALHSPADPAHPLPAALHSPADPTRLPAVLHSPADPARLPAALCPPPQQLPDDQHLFAPAVAADAAWSPLETAYAEGDGLLGGYAYADTCTLIGETPRFNASNAGDMLDKAVSSGRRLAVGVAVHAARPEEPTGAPLLDSGEGGPK